MGLAAVINEDERTIEGVSKGVSEWFPYGVSHKPLWGTLGDGGFGRIPFHIFVPEFASGLSLISEYCKPSVDHKGSVFKPVLNFWVRGRAVFMSTTKQYAIAIFMSLIMGAAISSNINQHGELFNSLWIASLSMLVYGSIFHVVLTAVQNAGKSKSE